MWGTEKRGALEAEAGAVVAVAGSVACPSLGKFRFIRFPPSFSCRRSQVAMVISPSHRDHDHVAAVQNRVTHSQAEERSLNLLVLLVVQNGSRAHAVPAPLMSVPCWRFAVGNCARMCSMGIDCRITLPGPSRVVEKKPSPLKQHVQQFPFDLTSRAILLEKPTTFPVETTITSPGPSSFSKIVPEAARKHHPGLLPGSIFCMTKLKPPQQHAARVLAGFTPARIRQLPPLPV